MPLFFSTQKMSCIEYIKKAGITSDHVKNRIAQDSWKCLLTKHNGFCSNVCENINKNEQGCYSCLSNKSACSVDGKNACCPYIKEAFSCLHCLSKNNQDIDACLKENKKNELIWIIVGSVAGLVVLLVIIVTVIKYRKKKQNN